MPPTIQQQLDALQKQINNLSNSSTISRNIETAFRERLNAPTITIGVAAPVLIPAGIGYIFCDMTNGKVYISTGITASGDWKLLN